GAGRLTAALLDLGQAGGQQRASRSQLLEAAVEHPTDQRGVARHMHRWAPGTSGKWTIYRERPEKPEVRRKKWASVIAGRLNRLCTLHLCRRQGATNSPFLRAGQTGRGVGRIGPCRSSCPISLRPNARRWSSSSWRSSASSNSAFTNSKTRSDSSRSVSLN